MRASADARLSKKYFIVQQVIKCVGFSSRKVNDFCENPKSNTFLYPVDGLLARMKKERKKERKKEVEIMLNFGAGKRTKQNEYSKLLSNYLFKERETLLSIKTQNESRFLLLLMVEITAAQNWIIVLWMGS